MSEKPGILYVVRPSAGGIARHIVTLVTGVRDFFDVSVACAENGSPARELRAAGVTVINLPLVGEISPAKDLYSLYILTRYMTRRKITVMHAHGAKAALLARPAALMAGVPVCIYTAHNSVICESRPSWKKAVITAVERLLSMSTDRIIAVSGALGAEITSKERIIGKKIVVIPNGISFSHLKDMLDPVEARSTLNIPGHRTVVGTVARMAPQKGLEFFVRAAEILVRRRKHLHFIIAGDGPLRDKIQNKVYEAGLQENFTLPGKVEEISLVYSALDVFVLPSLTEGLPLSLLEAMACSLPVVATSTGGVPEVIQNQVDGLLVPPGCPGDMAGAIARILDRPEDAAKMGINARTKVFNKYSSAQMIEKTVKLYRYLLEEKGLSFTGNELILASK